MSGNNPKRILPILPEQVVEKGWALTLAYSKDDDAASASADETRNHLKQIRNDLQQKIVNNEKAKNEVKKALDDLSSDDKNKIKKYEDALAVAEKNNQDTYDDLRYFDNISAALDASERTIHTIVKGRDQNFEQTDSLMKTQIANIESSARLTADLHSAIPRLFVSGSGAVAPILINYILQMTINYTIPIEVLAAAATIAAGAFFGLYQWQVVPRNIKKTQAEIIYNDYRRGIYYRHYIDRVVSALGSLFNQALSTYEIVYGEPYNTKYSNEENKQQVIWTALGGKKGIYGGLCKKMDSHYHKNVITPENWASCETGQGCEDCTLYKQ